MVRGVQNRHRWSRSFIRYSSRKRKMPPFPAWGTRTECIFCGTTLFAGKPAARPGANTPAALNAGNTSSDTPVSRFPSPSAAHLLHRFSLRSQPPELSVDAPAALLPRLWFGAVLRLSSLNYIFVRLSSTFSKKVWKICKVFFTWNWSIRRKFCRARSLTARSLVFLLLQLSLLSYTLNDILILTTLVFFLLPLLNLKILFLCN